MPRNKSIKDPFKRASMFHNNGSAKRSAVGADFDFVLLHNLDPPYVRVRDLMRAPTGAPSRHLPKTASTLRHRYFAISLNSLRARPEEPAAFSGRSRQLMM